MRRYLMAITAAFTCLIWYSPHVLPSIHAAGDRESLRALLPTEKGRGGWRIASELDYYEGHNLWEYINGQAELYLQYGFKMVVTADYDIGDGSGALAIEIYEMESPLHAFGIYAAERSPQEKYIAVGVQGYMSSNVLNFWDGPYYVKLTCFQEAEGNARVLQELAQGVAGRIKGEYSEPALFSVFPQENKVTASERFIPNNFLGLTFLSNGYRVDYQKNGKQYQSFVVDARTTEKAGEAFNGYQDFLRSSGVPFSADTEGGYRRLTTEDGNAFFLYASFFGGVLNSDREQSLKMVEGIVQNLKRHLH